MPPEKCSFPMLLAACGRAAVRESRCIFHLEKKTPAESDTLQQSLPAEVEKLKNSDIATMDLTGFVFPNMAKFIGFTFSKPVGFFGVMFEKGAYFSGATFQGKAYFCGAKFKGETSFDRATFQDDAEFSQTTVDPVAFFPGAEFNQRASFSGATFKNSAKFRSATFHGVTDFSTATFEGEADYTGASFRGSVTFQDSRYSAGRFDSAEFLNEIDWSRCRFKNELSFSRAFFTDQSIMFTSNPDAMEPRAVIIGEGCLLAFDRVRILEPKGIEFVDIDLSKTRLLHTDVSHVRFLGERWPVSRKGRSVAYDEKLLKHTPKNAAAVAELYRRLRRNYEVALRYSDAGQFFVGEMEVRKWALSPGDGFINWLKRNVFSVLGIYGFISQYGESYWRPILIAAALIPAFAGIRILGALLNLGNLCIPQIAQMLSENLMRSAFVFFQLRSDDILDLLERVFSGILFGVTFIALKRQLERH